MSQIRAFALLIVAGVAALSWALTCGAWQLQRVVEGVAPLDPVGFERMTLVTLGTGGAYENPRRRGPAIAVGLGDRLLVVDAGRGVAESLRHAGIPVSQPDTVLLTNLLPENAVGLDDLLLTGWLEGRSEPLLLIGPKGTASLAESLARAHAGAVEARGGALDLPPGGARFEVREVDGGWSDSLGGISVRAGALPGGPVPAHAYRFESEGRSIVVAGTGWAPEALVEIAQGADVLVHGAITPMTEQLGEELGLPPEEALRLTRESELETPIDGVGALAQRAGVGTLVLVRLRPPPVLDLQLTSAVGRSYDGRIRIPDDGDRIAP